MAKMIIERTGTINRPRPTPRGSEPESHPINGELIRPLNPQVIANPIAVADCSLNSLATIAIVVGNTGAMAAPARNTRTEVNQTGSRCRIMYVVPAINNDETITTIEGEMRHRTEVATIRPHRSPQAKPSDNTLRATAVDMPDAMRNLGSQFQMPNSHAV